MKIIIKMVEEMCEELEGAKKYIKCASKYKNEYPSVADGYYNMSLEEMKHFEKLHDMAATIINEFKMKNEEKIDEKMMAIYEYEHEKAIEKASEIKIMQEMYKK